MLYITYNSFSGMDESARPSTVIPGVDGCRGRPDPKSELVWTNRCSRPPAAKVNTASHLASRRGGTTADFGGQAPRPPTDLGRLGPVHDDRDGPAGEPPEDAPSGKPEGHVVRGDGGGQA